MTFRAIEPMNPKPIEIRTLSPEHRDDFLAYFEREAFADNPRCAPAGECTRQRR